MGQKKLTIRICIFVMIGFLYAKGRYLKHTICSRRLDPIYIVTFYRKWIQAFWTYSMLFVIFFLHSKIILMRCILHMWQVAAI